VAHLLLVADVNAREEKRVKEDVKDKAGKVTGSREVSEIHWVPGTGKVDNGIANVGAIHAAVVGAPAGAALEVTGNRIAFKIPPRNEAVTFKVLIAGGGDASKTAFDALAKSSAKPTDLTPLTKGGPGRWKDVIETKGELAQDKAVNDARNKLKDDQDKAKKKVDEIQARIKRNETVKPEEITALKDEVAKAKVKAEEVQARVKKSDLKGDDLAKLKLEETQAKQKLDAAETKLKNSEPLKADAIVKLKEEEAKAKVTLTENISADDEARIREKTLDSASGYVSDRLTVPYKNPYESWMRTAAFDFFSDGTRAAVSTWSGDVWIVSGIDDKLEHLKWKRFATGLHQPLGLKIVNDEIYALCRDQITKLTDLNGDGEADFYQCFNNSWEMTTAFHAFAFDLQTDPEGNFFFAFGSPVKSGGPGFHKITKTNGTIMKVSKDGSKLEIYACGLRAPNGMGVGPHGEVTIGDNEGSWVPTSPLHWVKQGQFLGMAEASHGLKVEQPKPLLWLPHNSDKDHPSMDNSCGGQVWVTSDKWGPYNGYLMHMSYGTSSLFLVMPQEVNGQMQGAAVKIPVSFTSSAMRARFNPKDGQLYVVGLNGWQSNASNYGGFDRVRYVGKTPHLPSAFKATKTGITLTYATALDQAYANDASNYSVEAWNYAWTSTYGSPEFTLENSKKRGRDSFTVKSAKLQPDGKTVVLEMPDIKPCMQLRIKANIKAADGVDVKSDIYGTIYNLAD
jgi:hypothetical protein